jgi:hypothetical protein
MHAYISLLPNDDHDAFPLELTATSNYKNSRSKLSHTHIDVVKLIMLKFTEACMMTCTNTVMKLILLTFTTLMNVPVMKFTW